MRHFHKHTHLYLEFTRHYQVAEKPLIIAEQDIKVSRSSSGGSEEVKVNYVKENAEEVPVSKSVYQDAQGSQKTLPTTSPAPKPLFPNCLLRKKLWGG